MADITDPEAVAFSNSTMRTIADRIASLYYECKHLKNLKTADADTPTTISLRSDHIRSVATQMIDLVYTADPIDNVWFNIGTGGAMNGKITNDAADTIVDGSPGDGRTPINGADIHTLMSRVIDIGSWMKDAAFGGPATGTSFDAMLNTMLVCSKRGNDPLQVDQVNTFVDNRCGEIVAEYEANANAKLVQVLAVAVNPRDPSLG